MQSTITVTIEHHPGCNPAAKVERILDTLLPELYAVWDHKIEVNHG